MKRGHVRQGFTIIELMVVIIVIGLLATIGTVAYNGVQDKAKVLAVQDAHGDMVKQIESFTDTDVYPQSISNCPTPTTGNLCIQPKAGQTISYYAFNPTSAPRYSAARHSTTDPAFELLVREADGFYYKSNAEMSHTNEFVQYTDMAPIINQYGLRKYTISFDIKSANIASRNTVQVYMQNGSGSRYNFAVNVPVTTSYERQSVTIMPTGPNTSFTPSILAFYGTYGTGNLPTIKNLEIKPGW